MTTKDNFMFLKDRHKSFDTKTGNQYSDLNLNQSLKCSNISPTIQSFSKSHDDKKYDPTIFEIYERNEKLHSWKNSTDLCFKYSNVLSQNDETKKSWKNENTTNNSIVSLLIAAHKSSNEDLSSDSLNENLEKSVLIKKQKKITSVSTFVFQNPFEFQKQQNDKIPKPEVSQFKASKRLINSNKAKSDDEENFSRRRVQNREKEFIESKQAFAPNFFSAASTIRRTCGATATALCSIFKSNRFHSNAINAATVTNKSEASSFTSTIKKPITFSPLIPGFAVENNAVMLWCFPYHISQTRLGERGELSNACCLISAALAEIIYRNGIYLPVWDGKNCIDIDALYFSTKQQHTRGLPISTNQNLLPSRLCDAMVNAIVNGNVHADLAYKDGKTSQLFNVPTALELLGSKSQHGDSTSLLYGNLKSAIEHPSLSDWKQLFFLAMFVERCVLIVHERDTNTVGILDSHTHKHFGALIAVSNHENLNHFCTYIIKKFFPETLELKPKNMKFEMSLLHFQGTLNDLDTPINGSQHSKIISSQKKNRPSVFENYEKCLKETHWKNSHYLHKKKKKSCLSFWKRS